MVCAKTLLQFLDGLKLRKFRWEFDGIDADRTDATSQNFRLCVLLLKILHEGLHLQRYGRHRHDGCEGKNDDVRRQENFLPRVLHLVLVARCHNLDCHERITCKPTELVLVAASGDAVEHPSGTVGCVPEALQGQPPYSMPAHARRVLASHT